MKYQKPRNAEDPNAAYWNGDRAEGIVGAKPPAEAIEQPMREIVGAISGDGQTPTEGDLSQLAKAIPSIVPLAEAVARQQFAMIRLQLQVMQLRGLPMGGVDPNAI
jgi:hypothetical protein